MYFLSISIEFIFQLVNIVLLTLIPVGLIKKYRKRKILLDNKVCELEDRVNNLDFVS